MGITVQDEIEALLIERRDWVSAAEICARFGLRERVLRSHDDHPGLCTLIAVSGNKGYKHVAFASTEEWDRHYARERGHNLTALYHLRRKRARREAVLKQLRSKHITVEKDTNQIVMEGVLA